MKEPRFLRILLVFLCAGIIVSCDDDDPITPDPTPEPAAPTELMATALSSTSIGLKWVASADVNDADFDAYVLTVTEGANSTEQDVSSFSTSVEVTALTEGTVYTFDLKSRRSDGTLSSVGATVSWAPAARYLLSAGEAIRVYEFASSFGSGLELYNATDDAPGVRKISDEATSVLADIVFDDRDSKLIIGSPTMSAYVNNGTYNNGTTPRVTLIGKVFTDVDSFDEIYDTEALDQSETMAEGTVDFTGFQKGFAFAVKTESGNFAKVLVRPEADGDFLYGATPNQHIIVEVSYQSVADVPYAIFQNPPKVNKPTPDQQAIGVNYNKLPFKPY